MAKKEELAERVARLEAQLEQLQQHAISLKNDIEKQKTDVREYVDKRAKELFELCLNEHSKEERENRKSASAITLSWWQLIIAVLAFVGLIATIILQAISLAK